MLSCSNISVKYGNFPALNNVSLEFQPACIHVLFGPNGAGKTTLLKVLSSILKPTAGNVYYNAIDINANTLDYLSKLGFLSHDLALYNNLTARENLSFWADLYSISNKNTVINELLETVKLKEFENRFVKQFSRGMKQRLAIAKSLLHKPIILIWDEPFAGIDIMTTQIICAVLAKMKQEGALIILSTHDIVSGYQLAEYIYIMNKGKMVTQIPRATLSFEEFSTMFSRLLT
jgi:heme exporter protein A